MADTTGNPQGETREIGKEMNMLENEITSLENAVQSLEDGLVNVMREENKKDKDSEADSQAATPLGTQIHTNVKRLRNLHEKVKEIIGLLEV